MAATGVTPGAGWRGQGTLSGKVRIWHSREDPHRAPWHFPPTRGGWEQYPHGTATTLGSGNLSYMRVMAQGGVELRQGGECLPGKEASSSRKVATYREDPIRTLIQGNGRKLIKDNFHSWTLEVEIRKLE